MKYKSTKEQEDVRSRSIKTKINNASAEKCLQENARSKLLEAQSCDDRKLLNSLAWHDSHH